MRARTTIAPRVPSAAMRALVQRVERAAVRVDGAEVSAIGPGLLVLLGVTHDDGPAQADTVKVISSVRGRTLIQITLHEGRNRIVRRMFDAVGHPVKRLTRTAIGPVRRGNLHTGELRELDQKELGQLLDLVDL